MSKCFHMIWWRQFLCQKMISDMKSGWKRSKHAHMCLSKFCLEKVQNGIDFACCSSFQDSTVSVLFSLFLYIPFSNFDSIMHSLCICNFAVKFYLYCVQVVMVIHIFLSHNMYCITFFASPKFGACHADRCRNTGVLKHMWCKRVWFCLITLPQAQLAWWQQYGKSSFFKVR